MTGRAKHLILPVETVSRELDAKLLFALRAVERGATVTLGVKALLDLALQDMPRGVYLSHNFGLGRRRMVALARKLGHHVVGWDEEGLVWLNAESYRERRSNREVLSKLDMVFAWGDEHAEALAPAVEGLPVKVRPTGNPRADLLRPEFRELYTAHADEIRREFGDFVLINSNFGWLNHVLNTGRANSLEDVAKRSRFPLAYLEHRAAIYEAFKQALPEIARRFPGRKVVVRPHPSEDASKWAMFARDLPNVVVRYDSALVPWLLAASHIVQNGCTTAVEAAMLGRTAISYRPVVSTDYESPQPNAISAEAGSLDELLDMLADPALTDRVSEENARKLRRMVASVEGPSASERIVDAIDGLLERESVGRPWSRVRGRADAVSRRVQRYLRGLNPASTRNPAYTAHKFPPTGPEEIAARLAALAGKIAVEPPEVEELSDRLFRLTPG